MIMSSTGIYLLLLSINVLLCSWLHLLIFASVHFPEVRSNKRRATLADLSDRKAFRVHTLSSFINLKDL